MKIRTIKREREKAKPAVSIHFNSPRNHKLCLCSYKEAKYPKGFEKTFTFYLLIILPKSKGAKLTARANSVELS